MKPFDKGLLVVFVLGVLVIGCSKLQDFTGMESFEREMKSGETVGCGPIDPVTKLQECSVTDKKGTTRWTVNHNEKEAK